MVKSLDITHGDFSRQPGRRLNNAEIGMLMLAKLAESMERYRPQNARTAPVAAVEELLRTAKSTARRTGQTVRQVLRNHQEALEAGGQHSKFILTPGNASGPSRDNSNIETAMALQDERRATHEFSEGTRAAGQMADLHDASRQIMPYVEREELRPRSTHATGALALPAPRHSMGGSNPNADLLRLTDNRTVAQIEARQPSRPLRLRHTEPDGGGTHNPHLLVFNPATGAYDIT